ncbi:MAG: chromate efflux transporter [Candidatus Nanopelagicales bacterium]
MPEVPPAGPDGSAATGVPAPGVGRVFLRLGLTSIGGPVAHLGYFRTEFVVRRGWLGDSQYADLVALAQFLPGPASSQVGMGIGLARSGVGGAVRAWLGFTMPSAVLLIGAGHLVGGAVAVPAGVVAGLQVAVVAVVAQAVVQMARGLLRTRLQGVICVASAAVLAMGEAVWLAPAVLAVAAGVGVLADRDGSRGPERVDPVLRVPSLPRWAPGGALAMFGALLLTLPILARVWPSDALVVLAGCYRAGALVFGGGHVVLPMLEQAVVGPGLISESDFLAGYGLAAAVPGPLVAFAGYLGSGVGGVALGAACVVAIFLPGFLLVLGVLGHWHRVAQRQSVRSALAAVNAAVVGLLAAALYDPVWVTGITGWPELGLGAVAFLGLWWVRTAPHLIVLACAVLGWAVLG